MGLTGSQFTLEEAVASDSLMEACFDEEGFLIDPGLWTETLAEDMAVADGLPGLSEAHWRVIRFLRNYYLTVGKSPLNKELARGAGITLMEIESLFPRGIKNGARRLAGLPNPKGC